MTIGSTDRGAPFRPCRICCKPFPQRNSMQTVCGVKCATKVPRVARKEEAAKTRAQREAMKSIPDLTKEAQREFNAYCRARDEKAGYSCICCGSPLDWGAVGVRGHSVDCGHYRSTGSAPHLRFDERNAHAQRVVCNRHGAGRAVDYRVGLIKRIGLEQVEALESSNGAHKWTRDELRAIRDTYRAKAKTLIKSRQDEEVTA